MHPAHSAEATDFELYVWRNINTIISWQNGIEILQWLDLPVMFRCAAFCSVSLGWDSWQLSFEVP